MPNLLTPAYVTSDECTRQRCKDATVSKNAFAALGQAPHGTAENAGLSWQSHHLHSLEATAAFRDS
jgi:hypothetical protein